MVSLILAVVVGFAFEFNPEKSDDLNVINNPVLFNRVDLLSDWINMRRFTPEDKGKLRVILSGRGAIRESKKAEDTEKLRLGKTEATVMAKYIREKSKIETNDFLQSLNIIEEENSRVTLENAIFTFWTLKQLLLEKADGNLSKVPEDQKIELNFFTSDFHLVRSFFLFKIVYDIVKEIDDVLKKITIPELGKEFHTISSFSEADLFPSKIIYSDKEKFQSLAGAEYTTTDFASLKSDQLTGFFGFFEKTLKNRWETLSKEYNLKTANNLLTEVNSQKESFVKLRGIKQVDIDRGILKFYEDVVTKFIAKVGTLPDLLI